MPELNDALKMSIPSRSWRPCRHGARTFVGLVLGRYSFRGRGPTNFVIFLAIAVPEIVLGSSLFDVRAGQQQQPGGLSPLGFTSILFSHIAFSIAFVAITVRARVQGLDRTLENAAQDLFATPAGGVLQGHPPDHFARHLRRLPARLRPVLDDFVITNFVNGTTNTFPTWVFGASRLGVPPQVNVWGTVLFTVGW